MIGQPNDQTTSASRPQSQSPSTSGQSRSRSPPASRESGASSSLDSDSHSGRLGHQRRNSSRSTVMATYSGDMEAHASLSNSLPTPATGESSRHAIVSAPDVEMSRSTSPSPYSRPSPSPSSTSQSDDQEREEEEDEDEEDDHKDFTDLATSAFANERRNTIKAKGSAALPVTAPGATSSETWQMVPANAKKASAATLPHEILLHIFKYVAGSPPDLAKCLLVCKAWCLCGVELLWHRPAFYKLAPLVKLIHHLKPGLTFPYATFIRRLNFSLLAPELEDSLFSRMAACNRLERLTLAGCARISDEAITAVLANTKNLVAADLTDVHQLTDKTILTIAQNCHRLQGINLSGCRLVSDEGIATLARNCKLLRRVKLCGCIQVGDKALQALAQYCPVLLEVDMIGCPLVSDVSVREIWKHSYHMRELRLAQCGKLTDLAFPAPASSFSGSAASALIGEGLPSAATQVAVMPIGTYGGSESAPTSRGTSPMGNRNSSHDSEMGVAASSDDINGLIRRPSSPPMHTHLRPARMFDHLRILDLTNCGTISDAAIEGIVSNVPRIRNFILAKCTRLTNESAYSIARLGKNLHYLHLGHVSNLTDRAVCHLARSCTRLRYIDLACCPQLTDLSVFELANNLPKLRRIGLVRVVNLTDQAIYSLVERYTSLERIHLSYCENVSVPAVFWLLQRLHRLTHLSLTGVPAFRRPELQSMCRSPPKEFNAHQRQAFCVYSGKGVNELRKYLTQAYSNREDYPQFGELTPDIQRAWDSMHESQERRRALRAAVRPSANLNEGLQGYYMQYSDPRHSSIRGARPELSHQFGPWQYDASTLSSNALQDATAPSPSTRPAVWTGRDVMTARTMLDSRYESERRGSGSDGMLVDEEGPGQQAGSSNDEEEDMQLQRTPVAPTSRSEVQPPMEEESTGSGGSEGEMQRDNDDDEWHDAPSVSQFRPVPSPGWQAFSGQGQRLGGSGGAPRTISDMADSLAALATPPASTSSRHANQFFSFGAGHQSHRPS